MHLPLISSVAAVGPLAAVLDSESILSALVYSLMGVTLFTVVFFAIIKLAPFSIRKEIEEDQNTSLGIIIGAVILGISLIISSAVQG